MLCHTPPPNTSNSEEEQINELAKHKIISLIDSAEHHIKLSMDVWSFEEASQALIRAYNRGVGVELSTNQGDTYAIKLLEDNGIKTRRRWFCESKFMIVDHKTLVTGSSIWDTEGFSVNDGTFVILYNLSEKQINALDTVLSGANLSTARPYNFLDPKYWDKPAPGVKWI